MLENLALGLATVIQPVNLLFIVIGVALGIIFGVIPGLTATLVIALLLPFTFGMDALPSMLMLLGIYSGSMYSSSVTAITIRIPGNPGSAVMVLDGYPLGQKGRAGEAIGMACIASVAGSLFSVMVMILVAPVIANVALRFSAAEYFAIGLFGLTAVAAISGTSILRGLLATCLGLFLATIGTDALLPAFRYTGDMPVLMTGVPLLPAVIGLFAISELFRLGGADQAMTAASRTIGKVLPSAKELLRCSKEILRGSVIGTGIGVLPGAGATIASFMAYSETKRSSKHPETFGKGEMKGVASPDAASNGVTGGSMIPMLSLGIPGDAVTAVLLGALVIQGVQPGPALFTTQTGLVYSIFVGMLISALVMLVLGLVSVRAVASLVKLPPHYLIPVIALFSFVGAFANSGRMYDVWLALGFGVIGYLLERYGVPVAPVVLGIILGPIIENAFRRAMIMSGGDLTVFLTRPLSLAILMLSALVILLALRSKRTLARTETVGV